MSTAGLRPVIWGDAKRVIYPVRCPLPFDAARCADLAHLRIEEVGGAFVVVLAGLDDDGELYGIGTVRLSHPFPSVEQAEAFALTIHVAGLI